MMKRRYKELVYKLAELSVFDDDNATIAAANEALSILFNRYKRSFNEMADFYFECVKRIYKSKTVRIEHAGSFQKCDNVKILRALGLSNCVAVKEEDNRLIGGFRVIHDDVVWDLSIQSKLMHLKQQFKEI